MKIEETEMLKKLFYCPECKNEKCIHRDAFRRMPREIGGLGLCPNLKIKKGVDFNGISSNGK